MFALSKLVDKRAGLKGPSFRFFESSFTPLSVILFSLKYNVCVGLDVAEVPALVDNVDVLDVDEELPLDDKAERDPGKGGSFLDVDICFAGLDIVAFISSTEVLAFCTSTDHDFDAFTLARCLKNAT